VNLKRFRIGNIEIGKLKPGTFRKIEGKELDTFLSSLGLK
jgi:16S rRNA U516 pseudouridylate synthase RsuA-like enzyme